MMNVLMEKATGGAFLVKAQTPQQQFTAEDLNEEHRAIARAAQDFWSSEIQPNLQGIHQKKPGLLRKVLSKSAEFGFTGITIPERYDGMELDLASMMIVEECFARDASYLVTHGGQAGIGALPLVFFGTDEQKQRYLPKLVSVEMVAAYALTEPQAGSDALNVRTHAELSADGTHFILNGQKMWITNGGMADLFTVFAKAGDQFTAFLVERSFRGVSVGAEEKKMGLHGSSTTAVFFDNVTVPVENVLGQVGRGHIIAFNVLNIGRLKIGPYAVGASKEVLALSATYAKQRKAFGSPIADFGAIQHKLAEMAIRIFAAEAMYWRVVGLLNDAEGKDKLQAGEEFAIECSIVKVYASEAVGYVTDEGVQIHGGYGYHQDYAVERFYRDARIFRIFEGTNEINRQLIVSMLLKRVARGRLHLDSPSPGADAISQAKNIALLALQAAQEQFGENLEEQQEVVMAIADIMIQTFAMESAVARAQKTGSVIAQEMSAMLVAEASEIIDSCARTVFHACGHADAPRVILGSFDAITLRRSIAQRVLNAGRYFA